MSSETAGGGNGDGNVPRVARPYIPVMPDWIVSGRCFAIGTLSYILRFTSDVLSHFDILPEKYFTSITTAIVIQAVVLVLVKLSVGSKRFGIAWRALFLGCVLNMGLTLSTYTFQFQTFGIYCIALSIFHWSEFMLQSVFNPETTDVDSYMLYHSNAYIIAFFTALFEFGVEYYYWPTMKLPSVITNIGITLAIFGESLRKASMWTAKSNFNHYVQFDKNDSHELVTHGVYGLFRHPSYVGWFWWSVGTQFILFNPFCMVAYAAASWKFFSERIKAEEMTLIQFFGTQYLEYQQRVGTGLPFIEGYKIPIVSVPAESSTSKKDE